MNYLSPIANDICWHHAVEKLFGIDITPRCKVLRTIMAELARIQDHLLCVGAAGLDLGAFTASSTASTRARRSTTSATTSPGSGSTRTGPAWAG
jgi:NADH:ubiquinone oxidoreductase subunit D